MFPLRRVTLDVQTLDGKPFRVWVLHYWPNRVYVF
jgi:hypothetical protein